MNESGSNAARAVGTPDASTIQPVVLQCSRDEELQQPDWLATVLGMGWPFAFLVLVSVLFAFGPRGRFGALLDAITNFIGRLKHAVIGSNSFSVSVAEEEALEKNPAIGVAPVGDIDSKGSNQESLLISKLVRKDFSNVAVGDYPYLMHEGKKTPNRTFPYAARVYLEFWEDNPQRFQKDNVEKVYYRVDDTFPRDWWVMTSSDRHKSFQLILQIVGEFTIIAVVKLKTGEYIWLTRYLDLPGRPTD